MDRNREARRASMVSANGLSRRRPRSSGLRDSPEEDGPVELQETARLRDRGVKKDRDRDRDRERDRDRDRLNRTKRRRADRLMHGSNREDAGDDSSEESVNDEEEEDDDDGGGVGGGAVRMLPPNPAASMSNHHHHQPHRKSYPPSATTKVFRPAQGWKAADEMIGFSVPRKARSVSTKRSHESWTSGSGVGGEQQTHRQASTSPVRPSLASPSRAGPVSPSSSNASGRKKMKPNGSKPRPPKSSGKSASSNPEELEFEIAEVLYGLMTQSQAPPKKEATANDSAKFDSREANKSNSDGKSRVSSPISNSASTAPQSSYAFPPNSSSGATPISVVAPKRKRPRQVSDNLGNLSIRNSPISSTTAAGMKVEIDQLPKAETSSPNSEKNPGSAADNGGVPLNNVGSEAVPPQSEPLQPDSDRPETSTGLLGPKPVVDESRESRDVDPAKEEVVGSPKKESPAVRPEDNMEESRANKPNSTVSEIETKREEKFEIDLMAPPPQLRSSPEREGPIDLAEAPEHKPAVPDADSEMRPMTQDKNDEKGVNVEPELKKAKPTSEETESDKKPLKERNIDLQLDLEKPDRDSGIASGSGISTGNKLHPHVQKQQQQLKSTKDEILHSEKTAQSSSLPLPMSVASWPGGLPPMGYMTPLQGVVSMDGSPVPPSSIQPLFSQPRPKRCATHCYIARSIHYLQQVMKMNPFWPAAAAGPASLFGAKACNLNVVPSAEIHGNMVGRSVNSMQDKGGQGMAIFPGHAGKDRASQAANIADGQRKQQILLQQAMPPGAPPNNILHAPAYIFPFNQQHVAAASVRPGSAKSPTTAGNVTSTSAPNSAPVNGSATTAPTAAAVSFNYSNLPGGETQYLAIVPNNPYHHFPIPAAVGAPPTYRGTHAQAMPYFNGSFYSSQMIHPAQLQQQQQQHTTQTQQVQQVHQNPSISTGSSSSQKHLQTQQQRPPQGSGINGGNGSGNIHSFPTPRNRPSQASQQQQQQPNQHLPTSHQGRQVEIEGANEDSPSTADSRVSRTPVSVYGQNYAMSIHHPNFAIMTPSALAGASASSNQNEKKQPQQQGMKAGVESLPQTFAMSFASINGASAVPGIDLSSVAQNHAVLQSLPEARHSCQIMAAAAVAQAAQQKKGFRVSEEGKAGGDSSSVDEDKKGLSGKPSGSLGQSIAFSRPDITDASVSTIPGSTVIDSSARSLNLVSASSRASRSTLGNVSTSNYQLQAQIQYQQQMAQLQKHQHQHQSQQIAAAVAARNKTPATSNGSVYGDHLTSSSPATAKFPNALAAFPQNLVQNSGGGSPAQSPQWKNSARTTTQVPSSFASSTTASLKNLPQQQSRTQQSHTLSFGPTQKSLTGSQGQQTSNSHQSPSPPMVVGSPTTSVSKGANGSPRTASSTSQGSKAAQPSTLSSQQSKNSASVPSQKSSPVGGRNVPSILGNPHITSSTTGAKPQMQQQQLAKQIVQQPQIFFSPAYMQAQSPASSTTSGTNAYYLQRRRPEQQQQSQQPQGSTSSTGMLSLCPPVTLASASTSDAKAAVAAAASNIKGGGLPSQSILHPVQFTAQSSGNSHHIVPTGFSYVPPAVQVKPAEQKQPAGNDNLHACWQPDKK